VGAAAVLLAFWSSQIRLPLVTVKWRWICGSPVAGAVWRGLAVVVSAVAWAWCLWPLLELIWALPLKTVRIFLLLVSFACCHGGRRLEMEERWFSCRFWVFLQLFPVLLRVLRRVMMLVFAGETDSTAGVIRGAAPADVPSASLRSWRSRRVATAAISTRLSPPKICSGDSVAACWCLFSLSGEVEASMQAAADLFQLRRSRGFGCNFTFFRVLSVIWEQLSWVWMVPVTTCFLT
jgi:hypothetical protein